MEPAKLEKKFGNTSIRSLYLESRGCVASAPLNKERCLLYEDSRKISTTFKSLRAEAGYVRSAASKSPNPRACAECRKSSRLTVRLVACLHMGLVWTRRTAA